jgi:hypothetical protein
LATEIVLAWWRSLVNQFNHRFLPRSMKPAMSGSGTECLRISYGQHSLGYQSLGQHLIFVRPFRADRLIIDERLIDSVVESMRQAKLAEKHCESRDDEPALYSGANRVGHTGSSCIHLLLSLEN